VQGKAPQAINLWPIAHAREYSLRRGDVALSPNPMRHADKEWEREGVTPSHFLFLLSQTLFNRSLK
jgi:hypothetical protein